MTEKKQRGPQPKTINVPLPFGDALKAALETPLPKKGKPKNKRKKPDR